MHACMTRGLTSSVCSCGGVVNGISTTAAITTIMHNFVEYTSYGTINKRMFKSIVTRKFCMVNYSIQYLENRSEGIKRYGHEGYKMIHEHNAI